MLHNADSGESVAATSTSARHIGSDSRADADAQDNWAEEREPLTRAEAEKLRRASPALSPWSVVTGQLLVGLLVALTAWLVTGQKNVGWSAFYGALTVVIPAALMARGLSSKLFLINPGAAVAGFFLWEMVKIGLTIAMLFTAPRWVPDLSWPAMLVGLVVTMKVVWLLLLLRSRSNRQVLIKRID